MVEVIKETVIKKIIRRRDYRSKQIGVEEDAIKNLIPTSSVTNVKNMVTMQTIVAEWVTMQ